MITNAIIEHDLETGARRSFYVGDASSAQEPQFVPRAKRQHAGRPMAG